MRLLCLSNGHGEDAIALRILQALRSVPHAPEISVLPIVGEGHAYRNAGLSLIGPAKVMPSGGFITMDSQQLARDLQGGLLKLTRDQFQAIRQWVQAAKRERSPALILAVGDIVPLGFAWWSGAPYAFVGTAKSEYYVRDERGELPRPSWWSDRIERSTGCIYLPWERWLMTRPNCKAVFPRDRLTVETLRTCRVPAFEVGNPMMDGISVSNSSSNSSSNWDSKILTIALLPGSRPPEAYENWQVILQAVNDLAFRLPRPIQYQAAIAPSLSLEPFHEALASFRWQRQAEQSYGLGTGENRAELVLSQDFWHCAETADLAIAMAGTATEQFVGLGKPAITVPGNGPQFNPRFAEAQTRLLGPSVLMLDRPTQAAATLTRLLDNPDLLQTIAENGRRRMGPPGAAARIADHLMRAIAASNP